MQKIIRKPVSLTLFIVVAIFILIMLIILAQSIPTPEPLQTLHCVGANASFQCSKRHFVAITKGLGVKTAMENLKLEYGKRSEIISDCHQLTHAIGNTAVDHYNGDIARTFLDGDSFCWSGYYHGVVERAVSQIGEAAFIANADKLCAAIPGKERYSFDYYNCVHGLGHGLMSATENQLFDSLSICDSLSGEWERKSCYGGVFMENIMVDNRKEHTDFLKPDDLMYPCTAVNTTYKEQCYLMQTSYALSKNGYDFRNAFELCSNVDASFKDTCGQSIGRDASGNSVSDVRRTVEHCALALDDAQQTNCIVGAVKDFISYFHGGDQAYTLCIALPERFKDGCLSTRASYLRTL